MIKKDITESIAISRIRHLAELAEGRAKRDTASDRRLAKRYTQIARAISSRYQVGMPKEIKMRICPNCGNFLVPGVNCKVKMVSSHGYLAYVCECGKETHVFYKKPKNKNKQL